MQQQKLRRKILRMKDKGEKHYTKMDTIFDLPAKILVIGRSQMAGKTNFVANLLLRPEFYLHHFKGEHIYIVSPSTETDQKLKAIIETKQIPDQNVMTDYDEEILMKLYDMLEQRYLDAVEGHKKPPNVLVFFDDMSFGGSLKRRQHGAIAKLFCNGRHLNISTIITAQKYSDVLTTCRENNTGAILFASTEKQLDLIERDHNYLPSKKQFKAMYRAVTEKPHSYLVVNYSNPPEQRYLDSEFNPIDPKEYDEGRMPSSTMAGRKKWKEQQLGAREAQQRAQAEEQAQARAQRQAPKKADCSACEAGKPCSEKGC